jgi:uncharacterized membrane protein
MKFSSLEAVMFQAVSGVILMILVGWPHISSWSIAVWSLFVLIGACWLPVVAIQLRLKRESEQASSIAALPKEFHRQFRIWFALGIPAFVAVVAIYYLIVAKPLSIARF